MRENETRDGPRQRRAQARAFRTFAEAAGCAEAAAFQEGQGGRPQYRILNAPEDFRGAVEALAVTAPVGRLGNTLRQILYAATLARRWGVKRFYLPPLDHFAVPEGRFEAEGLEVVAFTGRLEEIEETVLAGKFFHPKPFGPIGWRADRDALQTIVRKQIWPLLTLGKDVEQHPSNFIGIHLRAGDVFSPKPHPNYAQPPLAYYRLALRHFAQSHGGVTVTLVFEDEGNPVIAPLADHVRAQGFDLRLSSGSLEQDFSALIRYQNFIFGMGSFSEAVMLCCRTVESIYVPWMSEHMHLMALIPQTRSFSVRERAPLHIGPKDWLNTPEQRALMLDYDEGNLQLFEGTGGAVRGGPVLEG